MRRGCLLALGACLSGCDAQSGCVDVGCYGTLAVRFDQRVDGDFVAVVSAGGFEQTWTVPCDDGRVGEDLGLWTCGPTGFTVDLPMDTWLIEAPPLFVEVHARRGEGWASLGGGAQVTRHTASSQAGACVTCAHIETEVGLLPMQIGL